MNTAPAAAGRRAPFGVIVAAAVGSALEWYDFFIYGTAAALVLGPLFFPQADALAATLLAFATFGVGFVARPFGGLFFGHFGDRYGRKPVLVATLMLVGIGTALIGVLPTYAAIGSWAPFLLVILRLVQGFGAGAEYGGAVILLVEHAPPGSRGFWAGFAPVGVGVGNLLAAGAFAAVSLLPHDAFMAWGWRLPFLFSLVLVLFGLFVRLRVMETPVFRAAVAQHQPDRVPALEVLRRHPRNFFVLLGARMAENGLGYLFPVFGLAYVTRTLGMPRQLALDALMLSFMIQIICVLGFSALSDRIGRRPVYLFGALAGMLLAFPFFWIIGTRTWWMLALGLGLTNGVVIGALFGPQAAYFAELFGPKRRYSGFAFARELGSIVSGGPAPFLATAMVAAVGGGFWPVAVYIILLCAITAFAVWSGPETYRDDIHADAAKLGGTDAAVVAGEAG
ncbi:MAG: MHS family MFS transporter [Alphaproteobacteria bacterium]|nr:MHS family MFS transporter [Alphaproteobacteria bacterium]